MSGIQTHILGDNRFSLGNMSKHRIRYLENLIKLRGGVQGFDALKIVVKIINQISLLKSTFNLNIWKYENYMIATVTYIFKVLKLSHVLLYFCDTIACPLFPLNLNPFSTFKEFLVNPFAQTICISLSRGSEHHHWHQAVSNHFHQQTIYFQPRPSAALSAAPPQHQGSRAVW